MYPVTLERRKIILPWCGWRSKRSSCPSTPAMWEIKELIIEVSGLAQPEWLRRLPPTPWDESSVVKRDTQWLLNTLWFVSWRQLGSEETINGGGGYPMIVKHSLGCLMKAVGVRGNNKGLQFREESTTLTVPRGGLWGSHWLYFLPVQWQWVTW